MALKLKKRPVIDLGECVKCDICIELCPYAFVMNDADYIEVVDRDDYPEEDINDIIRNCRGDCITWDEEA